ncbi:MAG: 3-phosphoshikimate 1-carboxyvinyltransferase [Chitinophagaceae bacterium]|jgi:3-phosphoshikimate 1-carboxyvinyltransferase|nr:3-phosphoshikimate 1-carboxyvinyltransferase [Chitinophagaceae bacterium]OQY93081.1 MAG: 3-phosphoshikimate 1-carboxyvinyltransferase [Sphingobacteriales bacterium UTBCD1]
MIAIVRPSILSGTIQAPASKSSMQRALAAALLRKGTSVIRNPGHSNDDKAAMEIVRNLGAEIIVNSDKLIVKSNGVAPNVSTINCGESGLGIRMFAPIIALSNTEITVNGEGSLLNRPMNFFDTFFPGLGVDIKSNNGKLPLKIKGPIQPKNIEVDGSLSSQFITGLLLAYSSSLNFPENRDKSSAKRSNEDQGNLKVTIKVRHLKSKPYIGLTLDVMKQFGMNIPENRGYEEFIFHNTYTNNSSLAGKEVLYIVESDWSGGAFLLVAGAIAGPVTVKGLDLTSPQGDKKIIDALVDANAGIAIEAKGIKVRPAEMKSFEFDATDCPDLFPPLVALAASCRGTSIITGVHRLTNKESDRAAALKEEFGKMGVDILIDGDKMKICGTEKVNAAKVHSHHDHRIAMATAVAALKAEGETIIESAEAINKSYPDFFWHLKKLGADVSLPFKKFKI